MIIAADSRRFSVVVGLKRRRVLIKWAWICFKSLTVLHFFRIRALGFSGNWVLVVMAVIVLAGK